MPRLLSTVLSLRRDPRILKLPPYLSVLCIVVGIVSLLLLPLDNFTRRTYISENALLPGQVHTYFAGSDQNVFRAYKHEVNSLVDKSNVEINDKLESIFKGVGLKVGRQNFTYSSSGIQHSGENVYAILQAPRGDATEAIVLVTAWRNPNGELNRNGVALALTLARYFRRWSLWSKDIIFCCRRRTHSQDPRPGSMPTTTRTTRARSRRSRSSRARCRARWRSTTRARTATRVCTLSTTASTASCRIWTFSTASCTSRVARWA
ncbi:hypothetical protein MCOR01_004951 [Pyricularia oryzae]|nr:hypothetical protein MCOR01_004951 [Pyricularia oryzae]